MTEDKLRIPRLGLAVLVLGAAACGDDNSGDHAKTDAGAHDSGTGSGRARKDGGVSALDAGTLPGDDEAGTQRDEDASVDQDDAAAHADAEADAGAGADLDVSRARIEKVAADFCKNGFSCNDDRVLRYYDTEAMCEADLTSYWSDYEKTYGADCADAVFDLYACYATASCDELDTACADLAGITARLCPQTGSSP